jgi:hypothetical protein
MISFDGRRSPAILTLQYCTLTNLYSFLIPPLQVRSHQEQRIP